MPVAYNYDTVGQQCGVLHGFLYGMKALNYREGENPIYDIGIYRSPLFPGRSNKYFRRIFWVEES